MSIKLTIMSAPTISSFRGKWHQLFCLKVIPVSEEDYKFHHEKDTLRTSIIYKVENRRFFESNKLWDDSTILG